MSNQASDHIEALVQEASTVAYKEVERLARKIMKRNPKGIACFCMGMGSATFFSGAEGVAGVIDNDDPRVKELEDFVNEWNDTLKICGMPMRLDSHDGPLKTDW